jgi:hypothetical protein
MAELEQRIKNVYELVEETIRIVVSSRSSKSLIDSTAQK